LTDEEFERFIRWPELSLVLRCMCLASRTLGGMRTSDLHRWDWVQIELENWTWAEVPRPKTKSATRLVLPDVLVPVLFEWWRASGEPTHGPVFPRRAGPAKGLRQGKRSHVRELRRALWDAGVRRGATPETDPLQTDTDTTRRVDFHGFRRAYATGLARAGVNNQTAMALAGHNSPQTHQRYVRLVEILEAPAAALPAVSAKPRPNPLSTRPWAFRPNAGINAPAQSS
jgi:integrase